MKKADSILSTVLIEHIKRHEAGAKKNMVALWMIIINQ